MKYLKKSLFPVSLCFSILGLLVWLSADFASTVSTETTEAGFNSMFSLYIFSIVMSCISAALSIALVVFKTMETIQTSECRCKLIRKILRASGVLLLSIALILFVSGEYVHTHYLMDA
jgi:hypothetical protein